MYKLARTEEPESEQRNPRKLFYRLLTLESAIQPLVSGTPNTFIAPSASVMFSILGTLCSLSLLIIAITTETRYSN